MTQPPFPGLCFRLAVLKTSTRLIWKVALCWLIGVPLVWAALGKLADPHAFHTSLLAAITL